MGEKVRGGISASLVAILAVTLALSTDGAAAQDDAPQRIASSREYLASGRLDKAEKEADRALEIDPNGAEVHKLLCEIRRVQSRRDDAVRECRRAAEIDPSRADLSLELGDLLAQREDGLDEAMRSYRMAAATDPNNPRPHVSLGSLYERRSRLQEAEAEYREAIALNPNLVQANAGLGAVLFMTDRLTEARTFLSRAIELKPRDLRSHIFLGLSLNHAGQFDMALQELRTAASIDPHSANAVTGIEESRPTFEHLRGQFVEQLEARPKDASAWHNVAVVAYYLRDYEGAWTHIVKAQQLGYPVDQELKEVIYARWKRLSDR
ncbi:MAG TPA: tetratricopeptide repeat protein [Verrucomicrobiae bacterium]|nr:tetratricopeptide repeat protein [Verrucomicrobiae bacterium]